jgi:hypothetical protein
MARRKGVKIPKIPKRPCRALSKRTRQPCGDHAMKGCEVYYHHGGRSLSGPASPSYAHGKYSKFLPTRLAARYAAAERDPQLLSLQSELALTDARLADLLSRVDTADHQQRWQELGHAYDRLQVAHLSGDQSAMGEALAALGAQITAGEADFRLWNEIGKTMELRRKLAETEQKRLVTSQQMINSTEAMVLIARLTDITSKAVLGIAKRLSGEALAVAPAVEAASRQALSHIIVELQHVLTREDERPTFARREGEQ